jgi:hypothetical protein
MSSIIKGMKFILDNRVGECINVRHERPKDDYGFGYSIGGYDRYYKYDVKMLDNGEEVTFDGYAAERLVKNHLVYQKTSGFEIGDYFEIKRTGLQPDLRGRLISIDEDADRWPYRIADEDGNSASFSYYELTKIHSVISQTRAPKAIETLQAQLVIARAEVEALETALEVLQYASA